MIASESGSVYKKYQNSYINKNKKYLSQKGSNIKSVRLVNSPLAKKTKPVKTLTQASPISVREKKPNNSVEKLEQLASKVSQPLLIMTTLPILELFPTTITLDLKKITINTMTFIKSHSVQSITYDYLKEVSLESGLLSSTLRLVLVGNSMNPLVLPNFPKKQASMAKKIILGLMQCPKLQIKADDLDPIADREKIITLGAAASP